MSIPARGRKKMRSSSFQELRIVPFCVMSFPANQRAGLLCDARAGTLCLFAIISLPWRPRHFYCDESCFTLCSLSDRNTPLSFANRVCNPSNETNSVLVEVFVSQLVCKVPCEQCFSCKQNILFRTHWSTFTYWYHVYTVLNNRTLHYISVSMMSCVFLRLYQ